MDFRAEESEMGSLWTLITIVGPILLILALAWALLRNRKRTRVSEADTERATHDLNDEIDRESRD
jgi:cbb3-type cytochrome oxidase subunit 3